MFCTSSDEENCLLDAVLSRQELSSPDAMNTSVLCEQIVLLSLLQPTKGFLGNVLNVFFIINNPFPQLLS